AADQHRVIRRARLVIGQPAPLLTLRYRAHHGRQRWPKCFTAHAVKAAVMLIQRRQVDAEMLRIDRPQQAPAVVGVRPPPAEAERQADPTAHPARHQNIPGMVAGDIVWAGYGSLSSGSYPSVPETV